MRKCLDFIFCLCAFCGIVLVLLLILPLCLGIRPRIVLSGSMEPAIPVGSIAYVDSRVPARDIREQDVISYRRSKELRILHRVIRREPEQNRFLTKGDGNEEPDLGTVDFSQYEGKEVFSIPYLGYLVQFLQKEDHLAFLLGILILLLAADSVWRYREKRGKRKNTGETGRRRIVSEKLEMRKNISGKKESG